MLGCMEDAIIASKIDKDEPPEGWEWIGEGSSREAFLSPAGIVYKVDVFRNSGNLDEYENYLRVKKMPPLKGWEIPEMFLYKLDDNAGEVMAVEYVEGVPDDGCDSINGFACDCSSRNDQCVSYLWQVAGKYWDLFDLYEGNIILRDDGIRVLIDLEG